MATAEAIAKAARAHPDLRRYLPSGVGEIDTLRGMLDQLELAENEAANAYRKLVRMADERLDVRADYEVYAELVNSIYKAQLSVIGALLAVARIVGGPLVAAALAAALPSPVPLPLLTWGKRHAAQLGGLGFLPIVAGVIAVLAGMALLYLISDEVEGIADDLSTVFLARARAAQQTELLEARRVAYEACRARGDDDATCRATAVALTPTPAEAGTDMPDLPGSGGGGLATLGWLAIGGVVLVALVIGGGFVIRTIGRRRDRAFRGYGQVQTSPVGRLPRQVSSVRGASSYNLEVR